ncbi:MAG: hypothetical protein K0R15_373 [Clostridiales bacterium]|jgi:uncharacterized membrane protein|nr:hypothetical protein [Clostridiales bacterium]
MKDKDNKDIRWMKLMDLGARLGCHQMPERSLIFGGYQFPLCARCTGVILGYILELISLPFIQPNLYIGLICSAIMFLDWFIQFINILPSNNHRRIVTGILGGYGIMSIFVSIIVILFNMIF